MTVTHCLLLAAVCFVVGANVGALFLGAINRRAQHQEPPMTSITTEEIEALAERFAALSRSIIRDQPSTAADMLLAARVLRHFLQVGKIAI